MLSAAVREQLLSGPCCGCNPLNLLWNGKFYTINKQANEFGDEHSRWVIRFPCGAIAENNTPNWLEPQISALSLKRMWDRIGTAEYRGWLTADLFVLITQNDCFRYQLPEFRSLDRRETYFF